MGCFGSRNLPRPSVHDHLFHQVEVILWLRTADFSQQGISWITRKAISYATITLSISEYVEPDPAADNKPVVNINIEQTATGGIKGTTEKRVLSWVEREHSDHIFGNCVGQSRFVRGSKDENGKVRPDVDVQTKIGGNGVDDNTVRRFLRGEILPDGTETEGFLVEEAKEGDGVELGEGEGIWVQSWVKNKDVGWTAEQVRILLEARYCFCCWKLTSDATGLGLRDHQRRTPLHPPRRRRQGRPVRAWPPCLHLPGPEGVNYYLFYTRTQDRHS